MGWRGWGGPLPYYKAVRSLEGLWPPAHVGDGMGPGQQVPRHLFSWGPGLGGVDPHASPTNTLSRTLQPPQRGVAGGAPMSLTPPPLALDADEDGSGSGGGERYSEDWPAGGGSVSNSGSRPPDSRSPRKDRPGKGSRQNHRVGGSSSRAASWGGPALPLLLLPALMLPLLGR